MMNSTLRSLIAWLTMMTLTLSALAQTTGLNYQAVARDGSGALLANSSVNLEFEIRQGAIPGVIVYAEEATLNTNEFGLFSTVIGENNPTNPAYDFELIDWAADEHYLIIELNGSNVDTLRFQSVPYSRVATDMELEDLQRVEGAEAAVAGDVLQFDGSNWTAADAASPWIKTGNDLAYSPGKVFINRGFGVTGAEYFGFSTPTTGNAYGGMYVNTESANGRPFYGYATEDDSRAWTYWDGNDSTWKLYNRGSRMSITDDGLYGFETNNPRYTMHLVHATGAGTSNPGYGLLLENTDANDFDWGLYVVNSGGQLWLYRENVNVGRFDATGAYSSVSDARRKKHIASLEGTLDRVLKLNPVSYRFDFQEPKEELSLGFIAQEANLIFPELVNRSSGDTPQKDESYTINYAGFSVVAIKAIQEQQEVIEQQQHTIDGLMRRLEALEAQVNE